jgi:hypothetical protein
MFSRNVGLSGTFLALAAGGTAACDNDDDQYRNEERRYQCAVEVAGEERAVDCDEVDDDQGTVYYGGSYVPVFIHSYSHAGAGVAYAPGQRLPAGGYRIGYKDADGRARAGLPPSGRVANNTVKTGVVGKGGAPAPAGAKAGS